MNPPQRDFRVQRVILIEGTANVLVLGLKLAVGLSTGSFAVIGDAVHSLGDVANNVIAWIIVRMSARPADREHPYGHRKFETLAVFVLAALLVVLAIELALGALRHQAGPPVSHPWAVGVMFVVLGVNIGLTSWENAWAKRLGSDILAADARHTLADVLTTIVIIVGWQLAARGYPWMDTICALGVSMFVLFLAFGLFRRAVPILVDRMALEPEELTASVLSVPGARSVKSVRSRSKGSSAAVDIVVGVNASLSMEEAHAIADAVEAKLADDFGVEDATVHIEPDTL
ncbi:MAG: cation diffusion facilitator family transporter [Myxococcales bacterium]|nr:cation diffusion facilitator family transporter [Myxococcales bacterium]